MGSHRKTTSNGTGRPSDPGKPDFFETLEPRVLLTATLEGGVLDIVGDGADNAISITAGPGDREVIITGVPGEADGTSFTGVTRVNILAGDGDDDITVDGEIPSLISVDGEDGDDSITIEGSDDRGDTLIIKQGKKSQEGLVLVTGKKLTDFDLDSDSVENYTINGNGGDDRIKFQRINNTDLNNSTIVLNGGEGKDRLGGPKATAEFIIDGGAGSDRIYGGALNDFLDGGNGDDIVRGNNGEDFVLGGAGDDKLLGGNGNDTIIAGFGTDILNGGQGRDTASFRTALGSVVLNLKERKVFDDGFGGSDTKIVRFEIIDGSDFSDTLIGDGRNNRLNGHGGGDLLIGNNGDDQLDAGIVPGLGEDFFDGAVDTLRGGNGHNLFFNCEDPIEAEDAVEADPDADPPVVGKPEVEAYEGDHCSGGGSEEPEA